jgi:hypothetical protein
LDRPLNLLLVSLCDIAADGLRRALHRFSGHFQAGQHLHLLAPMIEGRLLTDQGMHAAHSGGSFGIHDIQLHIRRKLTLMTAWTQVIGPFHSRPADHSEHRFET